MGQSCVKGAMRAVQSKGNQVNIPNWDVAESWDAGEGPGKSSLFFLTARHPGIGLSEDRVQRPAKRRTSRDVWCAPGGPWKSGGAITDDARSYS